VGSLFAALKLRRCADINAIVAAHHFVFVQDALILVSFSGNI
jgi:hypothetical protein